MRFFVFVILFSLNVLAQHPTAAEYVLSRPEIFQADHPEVLTKLRKEVGDAFAQEVMDYYIKEIIVQNRSCDSFIGTCDFYLCQEQKNPCGISGYNLGYGYKYCSKSKFELLDTMKTPLGKAWVPQVFKCLQKRSLVDSLAIEQDQELSQDTCKAIKKKAFKSHPDCYVEAGYCELSILEKSNIVELILTKAFSFKAVTQGASIVNQCAKKIRD